MRKPLHLQNTTEIQRAHIACLPLKAAAQTLLWFKLTSTRFQLRWKLTLVHHCLSSTKLPMTESPGRSHTQALQKTDVHLKTYTGEPLCILETAKMLVTYGKITQQLQVYVVDGRGSNLMGRDWLESLNLTVGVINSLLTLAGLQKNLDKHVTVFSNKLGTLKGVKIKLQTNPDVAPQFFKACTIPLALREKVEAELERLESLGIIIPAQHSEWAAPVVPVLKHDGTMRLCGDYRVTITRQPRLMHIHCPGWKICLPLYQVESVSLSLICLKHICKCH